MPDSRLTPQEQLALVRRKLNESPPGGGESGLTGRTPSDTSRTPVAAHGKPAVEPPSPGLSSGRQPVAALGEQRDAAAGRHSISLVSQSLANEENGAATPPAVQSESKAQGRSVSNQPDLDVLIDLERSLIERENRLEDRHESLQWDRLGHEIAVAHLKEEREQWQRDLAIRKLALDAIHTSQVAKDEELRQREDALARSEAKVAADGRANAALADRLGAQAELQNAKEIDLDQRESALEARELKVAEAETRHRKRKQELRSAQEQVAALTKQVTSLTTSRKRLQTKFEEAQATLSTALYISSWDVAQWMLSGLEVDADDFADKVAFCGDGPFLQSELESSARNLGLKVGRCGARNPATILIVGRDSWDEHAIQAHLDATGEEELFIFPQELWIASVLIGYNPFRHLEDEADQSAVEAFGEGHPVIEWLRGMEFPWPEFQVSDGGQGSTLEQQVNVSPLAMLEYRVGLTNGQPTKERRRILSEAFSADELPKAEFREGVRPAMQREYMQSWGSPSSRTRLRRIAWHLAMLINMHSRLRNHDAAVGEWQTDLAWLRKTYYSSAMRFRWP